MKRYIVLMALPAVLAGACHTKEKPGTQSDSTFTESATISRPGVIADDQVKTTDNEREYKYRRTDSQGETSHSSNKSLEEQDAAATPNSGWDKKIIRTAHVELDLKDYTTYDQSLHNSLQTYGAYIAAEEQTADDYKTENRVTIKVPVDRFEPLLNSFGGEGIKVIHKKISAQEVTDEWMDTKSRIEAKKQTRDQYLALLKQAKNMKEVLQVREEINNIQEEIESGTGRVHYLSHQSYYSTIYLTYYQFTAVGNKPGHALQLGHAFETGSGIVWGIFIATISLWPLILTAIILYLAWKRRKQVRPLVAEKN